MPSGSITEGGKAQALAAVNVSRRGLSLQNESDDVLRILQGGVAASATAGTKVAPGALYETPTNRYAGGSWSIWGAATGQAYQLEEW